MIKRFIEKVYLNIVGSILLILTKWLIPKSAYKTIVCYMAFKLYDDKSLFSKYHGGKDE